MKSSTRMAIPVMHGVHGTFDAFPFTRNGANRIKKIHWITPMEIQWPDGWAIFKLSIVPRLQLYEGQFSFEIWDNYMMSQPRWVGRVKVDATTDTYEIELLPKFRCYRLTMLLLAHHEPQEPFYTNAFRNGTPYGDWRYKDVI